MRRGQAAADALERAVPLYKLKLNRRAVAKARLQDASAILLHSRHIPEHDVTLLLCGKGRRRAPGDLLLVVGSDAVYDEAEVLIVLLAAGCRRRVACFLASPCVS